MIESWIRIEGERCIVHNGLGTRVPIQSGEPLAITPMPDIWLFGQYGYDADHEEHYWKSDDEHFVGLISGMKVQFKES